MVSRTTITRARMILQDEDHEPITIGTTHFQVQETDPSSKWTFSENKLFENELAFQDENAPDRWQNIAKVTGKTVEEVKSHYQLLVEDLALIESDMVPLPNYKKVPPPNYKKDEAKRSHPTKRK